MYEYLKGCVISRSKGPTFFLGKSVTSSHEAFLSKLGQTKSQKWISFKEDMKHVIISSTSRNLDDSGQGIKIMNGQLRSNNDKNCNWIILADFSSLFDRRSRDRRNQFSQRSRSQASCSCTYTSIALGSTTNYF